MAEVTREMILEYMRRNGGTVKNVDLVRHFRKFLQAEDATARGRGVCQHSTLCCVSAGVHNVDNLPQELASVLPTNSHNGPAGGLPKPPTPFGRA